MRVPDGVALLLTGSGIYWVLSSQLIASFTVLTPRLFQTNSQGILLVLMTGVVSAASGVWIIGGDLERLQELFNSRDGWIFTIPVILAVVDISLTLIGLSTSPGIVELNPFVASAIDTGAGSLFPFTICYILMSEGVALLVLEFGRRSFVRTPKLSYLPFSLVCGSAALGPFSNIAIIGTSGSGYAILLGIAGSGALSLLVYHSLGRAGPFNLVERLTSSPL